MTAPLGRELIDDFSEVPGVSRREELPRCALCGLGYLVNKSPSTILAMENVQKRGLARFFNCVPEQG